MQIETNDRDGWLEVRVSGRLDSFWIERLASDLDECVRNGSHHIRLNMADVPYMSSAGIRVLLATHKQLKTINGSFAVIEPSEQVEALLKLSGLEMLMAVHEVQAVQEEPQTEKPEQMQIGTLTLQIYRVGPDRGLNCRLVGDPGKLDIGGWKAEDVTTLSIPKNMFALGLCAFGESFEDARLRFGDFLAAGGAVASLPTDGSGTPDCLFASGPYVPGVQVLYAAIGKADFPLLVRFEAEKAESIPLSLLVQAALKITGRNAVGLVMIVESAGLIGAALRHLPALKKSEELFKHPGIRQWLTFSPEHVHARNSVLVTGIAAAGPTKLAPILRPLGRDAWPASHFHAVTFSFRPLLNGIIDLNDSVAALFETGAPQNLLRLVTDNRDISGTGESEFTRGAMWVGGIEEKDD